jgi:diguanylate cyclase (GGDEF)-like protein/PAS domain S-box-containing protein
MPSMFVIVHRRWALITLLAVNSVVISVVAVGLKNRYDWAIHDAEVRAQNVALAIDLHLSSEISKIDLSLNTVISEFAHHLKGDIKTQSQVISGFLKNQKELLPETDGWGVTDATGRRIFNEVNEDSYNFSVADRSYFRDFQSGRAEGLIVSDPMKSKRTGNTVVVLSRPYRDPKGAFAGVVVVTLPVSAFNQVLTGFDLGPQGVVVVRGANLELITRVASGKSSSPETSGEVRLSSEMEAILASGTTQATFHTIAPVDQIERIYSYRRLSNAPIHVLAGVSKKDCLKDWHATLWSFAGFLGLFLLIFNSSAALLYRQWRRQQRDALSLRRTNNLLRQSLKELSERDNALVAAQEAGNLGTYTLNIPGLTWSCSPQLDKLFGIDPEFPHTIEGWQQLTHPDDREWMSHYFFEEVVGKRQMFDREYRVLRPGDGRTIWVHGFGKLDYDTLGEPIRLSGTIQDISARKFAEERMLLAQEVFQSAAEGVVVTDREGVILETNPAFFRITGYSSDEIKGQDVRILRSGAHDENYFAKLRKQLFANGYWEGEVTSRRKDGALYAQHSRISAIRDVKGEIVRFAAVISDVTELKESRKRLEYLAYHDDLTGIPNRTLLSDRMHQAIASCRRKKSQLLGICCLDLDGFKEINDCWGHDIGDQLLIQVSRRLQSCVRANDTVARLGGDEFVILLCDLQDVQDAIDSVSRLLQGTQVPYQIGAISAQVTLSIGITLYPSKTTDEPDALLRQADQAMYDAKRNGKNCMAFYDIESELRLRTQQSQYGRLAEALENNEFRLFYQPQVDLRSGSITGVEALIRWQHPERGLLPPGDFLAVMETSALTLPVGEWIIREALRQRQTWLEQGIDVIVSVNLFGLHLQRADFVQRLEAILDEYPQSHRGLEFEVVETTALENLSEVTERIQGCMKLGVSFSLDDFGTGYSSLTYLRQLPVGTVKIDRSFVSDMLENAEDSLLVESIVGMAHTLGRKVVAEGVETLEHGVQLIRCGCDWGQGYGIARPMPPGDLQKWIAQWSMPKIWSDAISIDGTDFYGHS